MADPARRRRPCEQRRLVIPSSGAIISGGKGTATEKLAAMRDAGIVIAETPSDIGDAMVKAMG